MKLVSPSLLSADFGNLQRDIEMLNQSECDWLHVDVMDGIFVPNISFGQPIVKHIKRHAKKPLDVHLMIMDPGRYINDFKEAGADILTVHYEACTHLDRTIHAIHDAGMKAGVVLNPHTAVCLLEDIVQECDLVLLMSVNPGFGGQKFIENTYNKVRQLHTLCDRKTNNASLRSTVALIFRTPRCYTRLVPTYWLPEMLSSRAPIRNRRYTNLNNDTPAADNSARQRESHSPSSPLDILRCR